jgi:sulfoxide reductase heme-binding subunit YedZ
VTGSSVFWYASRATGIVTLLLLTAVLVLGMVVNRRGRLPGLPGFAVTSLHRNLSLLTVSFIAVHVLTAVLDTYVRIPLASALIPFASGYERFWLGLGTVALDLMLAVIATSLVRGHLSRRVWRGVQHGRLPWAAVGCALVVLAAVAWRVAAAAREVPRAARVAAVFAEHAARSSSGARPGRRPAPR